MVLPSKTTASIWDDPDPKATKPSVTGASARTASPRVESARTSPLLDKAISAIVGQESGGNYSATNPSKAGTALGKYQVMDTFLPRFLHEAGLPQMTPAEYLASPETQDRLGRSLIETNLQRNLLSSGGDVNAAIRLTALNHYGDMGASKTGDPSRLNLHPFGDPNQPTPNEYANQVLGRFAGTNSAGTTTGNTSGNAVANRPRITASIWDDPDPKATKPPARPTGTLGSKMLQKIAGGNATAAFTNLKTHNAEDEGMPPAFVQRRNDARQIARLALQEELAHPNNRPAPAPTQMQAASGTNVLGEAGRVLTQIAMAPVKWVQSLGGDNDLDAEEQSQLQALGLPSTPVPGMIDLQKQALSLNPNDPVDALRLNRLQQQINRGAVNAAAAESIGGPQARAELAKTGEEPQTSVGQTIGNIGAGTTEFLTKAAVADALGIPAATGLTAFGAAGLVGAAVPVVRGQETPLQGALDVGGGELLGNALKIPGLLPRVAAGAGITAGQSTLQTVASGRPLVGSEIGSQAAQGAFMSLGGEHGAEHTAEPEAVPQQSPSIPTPVTPVAGPLARPVIERPVPLTATQKVMSRVLQQTDEPPIPMPQRAPDMPRQTETVASQPSLETPQTTPTDGIQANTAEQSSTAAEQSSAPLVTGAEGNQAAEAIPLSGGPDAGRDNAQYQNLDGRVPLIGQDRTDNTSGPGPRAEDSNSDRGDESLRQGTSGEDQSGTREASGATGTGSVPSGTRTERSAAGLGRVEGEDYGVRGAVPEVSRGADTKIVAPDGAKHAGYYAVVELKDITPSHDSQTFSPHESYPPGVQDRDYQHSEFEQGKVIRNANQLDPEVLIDAGKSANFGPPILDKNGRAAGGNSRTMGMERRFARDPEAAASYKAKLLHDASIYGVDPKSIERAEQLVLVRILPHVELKSDRTSAAFVRSLNENESFAKDETAMAVSAGRALSDNQHDAIGQILHGPESNPHETLADAFGSASTSKALIRALETSSIINDSNRPTYVEKGPKLTDAGESFVTNLLSAKIIPDLEVARATPDFIKAKIAKVALALSQASRYKGWDLAPHITQALEDISAQRSTKISDADWKGQMDFGREPLTREAEAMRNLLSHPKETKPLQKFAKQYLEQARQSEASEGGMFEAPKRNPSEMLVALSEKATGEKVTGTTSAENVKPIEPLAAKPSPEVVKESPEVVKELPESKPGLVAPSEYKLPSDLARMRPRYGQNAIQFNSDFDKVAYLAQSKSEVKRQRSPGVEEGKGERPNPNIEHAIAHVEEQTGVTRSELSAHGNKVRLAMRGIESEHNEVTGETIHVPAQKTDVKPAPSKTPLSSMADAARENIKRRKRDEGAHSYVMLDPRALKDYSIIAADYLDQGFTKLADWTKKMIEEFGEELRPHLDDIYKRATAIHAVINGITEENASSGTTETGGETMERGQKEVIPEDTFGIRNKITDPLREEAGIPTGLTDKEDHLHPVLIEHAKDAMDHDPEAGNKLVASLEKNPRPHTDEDVALLTLEGKDRLKARNVASREAKEAARKEATGEGTATQREDADAAAAKAQERLNQLLHVAENTEGARGLAARNILIKELGGGEFAYANIKREYEIKVRHGEPLDPANESDANDIEYLKNETKAIADLTDESDTAQAKQEKDIQGKLVASHIESAIKDFKNEAELNRNLYKEVTTGSRATERGKRFVERGRALQAEADAALQAMRKSRTHAAVIPFQFQFAEIPFAIKWAAGKMLESGGHFEQLRGSLMQRYGSEIEPHLDDILKGARDFALGEAKHVGADKAIDATGKGKLTGKKIYELLRARFNDGVKQDDLIKTVTNDLQAHHPGITEEKVKQLFTDYGNVKFPRPEADHQSIRELRRITLLRQKIADLQAGRAAKHTGLQRESPTIPEQKLQRELNALLAKQGLESSDPAKELATRRDAILSRMKNTAGLLDDEIATYDRGERPTHYEKGTVEYDAEMTRMKDAIDAKRVRRDALRDALDAAEGKPNQTEAQRLKLAIRAAQRGRDKYESLFNQGSPVEEKNAPVTETPELAEIRKERDDIRDLYTTFRDLNNPERLAKMKDEQDQKRIAKRMDEVQERIDKHDYAPRIRPDRELSQEAQLAKIALTEKQAQLKANIKKFEQQSRTGLSRALDTAARVRMFNILSSTTSIAKLAASLLHQGIMIPIKEAGGLVISRMVRDIAAKAPREGNLSFKDSWEAEHQAFMSYWKKGVAGYEGSGFTDALQKFRNQSSTFETIVKDKSIYDVKSRLDYPGSLHAGIKAPIARAEFIRSMSKRTAQSLKNGEDIHNPLIQHTNETLAAVDAMNAVYKGKNALVDNFKNQIEQQIKSTNPASRVAGRVKKFVAPIVKVPVEMARDAFANYALGLPIGGVKAIKAYRNGIENLTPEQADLIMRYLKKGAIGPAIMVAGFFGVGVQAGGYYQPGERRDPDDLQPREFRVLGQKLPGWASKGISHTPLGMGFNVGATIRRGLDDHSLPAAVVFAALGPIRELPFSQAIDHLSNLYNADSKSASAAAEFAKAAIPLPLQNIAEAMDPATKRKPKTFVENVEMAIPGLRENVPLNRYAQRDLYVQAVRKNDLAQQEKLAETLSPNDIKTATEQAENRNYIRDKRIDALSPEDLLARYIDRPEERSALEDKLDKKVYSATKDRSGAHTQAWKDDLQRRFDAARALAPGQ